jgi:hypothetical protein
LCRNAALERFFPLVNPTVNLEFNAHLPDAALGSGFESIECPVTFRETRLACDARRDVFWKTLCAAFLQRLVPPGGCVLELGTGFGNFINHIRCARRIALDRWEGMARYLDPGVEGHSGDVTDLRAIAPRSVDFVFASILFEHLAQSSFAAVLDQVRQRTETRWHVEHPPAEQSFRLPGILRRLHARGDIRTVAWRISWPRRAIARSTAGRDFFP